VVSPAIAGSTDRLQAWMPSAPQRSFAGIAPDPACEPHALNACAGGEAQATPTPSHEMEFEAPGLYAVTVPRMENALPRCAFPESWHSQILNLEKRSG
jgi:hypothetical protein